MSSLRVTSGRTIACARIGALWVAVTGERKIDDADWREYLELGALSVRKDGPVHGVLYFGPRHGPSAAQRKLLTGEYAEAIRIDQQRLVAVVSDSMITRGAIMAIQWVARVKEVNSFSLRHVGRALTWLASEVEFDPAAVERLLDEAIALV